MYLKKFTLSAISNLLCVLYLSAALAQQQSSREPTYLHYTEVGTKKSYTIAEQLLKRAVSICSVLLAF